MKKRWGLFWVLLFSSGSFGASNNSVVIVGQARFTVITPTCIRLEYNDKTQFVDQPSLFAINRDSHYEGAKIIQTPSQTTIDTGSLILTYLPNGKIFSDKNLKVLVKISEHEDVAWSPSKKNLQNLGGTITSLDDLDGPTVVGEGLLSRDGWYLLDDSLRPLIDKGWVAPRPEQSGTDWYFFGYGDHYRQALKDLTAIGGAIPLPRRYVLGSWYSRYWPYSSEDYKKIVEEYHDHQFPLDILVMDMDWHKQDNFTGYTWDQKLFPNSEDYLKWIHNQHLFATLNDHPQGGVGVYEENYSQFMTAMGLDPSKQTVLDYDAGNKKYLTNVFRFMHEPQEKRGVDFWWFDYLGDKEHSFNQLAWTNEFYYSHSRLSGLRGQQFSRWGGWGDHRHPIHFSGDVVISWKSLKFQVPFTSQSGNVGLFFWSHDMGGFQGKRNPEVLARWVQFGAFSAALRLHSFRDKTLDKRPWAYSQQIEDSMAVSFHLRSEFFPYTYSRVAEASSDSVPLLRPLYIDYPQIQDAYENSQEYLYGHDVLVAPIVEKGKGLRREATQKVWFPPGVWYDWFSGLAFSGEKSQIFSHGLNSFPLFVRGGVPLTLRPYTERMTTDPLKTLVVRVYPGEEDFLGQSQLYEDDGLTEDYLKGYKAITNLSYIRHGNDSELEISGTQGSFNGQPLQRSYILEFFALNKKYNVTVNGSYVPVKYNQSKGILRVEVPAQDIRQNLKVRIF